MPRLLVVDDERSMREMLEILLAGAGHEVEVAADVASALQAFSARSHDLVLTDLMLGRGSGLDILKAIKQQSPQTEVIVMTAFSTTEGDLQAMKLGAYDYVAKPFRNEELLLLMQKALEKRRISEERDTAQKRAQRSDEDAAILRDELSGRRRFEGLVGGSAAMQAVYQLVEKVAPTRTTVLA
ncbi:MAG: sigma-54-dependent Fis family transcriptional regulator, partial [Deltaproteobacteria bacterium]|nr:sigma-54-dependent Fis family transcriptional regulator [Deltaproteobacteria bacterium]